MEGLHVGLDRLSGIERCTVTCTFDEQDARDHGKPMQRVERVDHRLFYQAVDQQAVLVRIDIGEATASNYEMQAIGCDRPVEKMVRRACRAATCFVVRVGQRAHHIVFVFGGPFIRMAMPGERLHGSIAKGSAAALVNAAPAPVPIAPAKKMPRPSKARRWIRPLPATNGASPEPRFGRLVDMTSSCQSDGRTCGSRQ